MPRKLGRSGGPDRDRTGDLFIANDGLAIKINGLRHCSNGKNSTKQRSKSTNWAQSAMATICAASNSAPESMPLWLILLLGSLLVVLGWLLWYSYRTYYLPERLPRKVEAPAERDQEWCHYPQDDK